ncbi:MAG: CDP-alcohol phosphatidyltransferase family protein [Candidatus Nanopelagicales bacterium]|nr:CDP-alcohol phosphatidyltransferase family protein [Candidatus Nanopelagicales bacterium]
MTARDARDGEDRILTVPNALSVLRLLLIPLFLWLILVEQADMAAVVVLAVSGITDWADGLIARTMGQTTRLGRLLDPLVDRVTIAATLVGLALRDLIPWWLVGLLVAREVLLLLLVPRLRRHGLLALPVHYLGKAATFALYWGFPFVLVGAGSATWEQVLGALGWAFVIWGTALYWYAALLYVDQMRRIAKHGPHGTVLEAQSADD